MSVEAAATLVAPTVEKTAACISDFSARHVRYLTRFEKNYESLMRKMSELRCHRDHVKRRVEVDEASQQMRRTPIVAQWFERVRSFEVEVDAVLQECSCEIETGQRFCVNYCPKNWWLRYKIGKKVSKKLEVVVEVISNGQFEVVADKVLPSLVEVKYESQSVGMHEAFSQVSSWLVDDAVKIIGIYGMGGVGKTTLLKKINNVFKEKVDMLNVVIWVVVSSHPSLENVQRQIGRRLGLPWSEDEDQNDKAQLIFNALTKKKFLLLLDDVWKPLNFEEIGIPCQNPHSKVVFTTRSESVCGEMEADKKFKVRILERQQAWELFQHKVGQEVLNCHPEIPKLAKRVARECGGLPLALITIGRAMSSKKTTHEWNHALKTLKNNSSEFKGMEEKVLSILKFSYDNLEDDTARYCFLYFSLYPEDWEIPIDHIIRRWIGEGFLDKFKDMDDALNKGYDIIGSLKAACLLETSTLWGSCVKMHDSVRDLALWITSDCGKKENKHLVQAGVGLSQAREIEGWKNAKRISLMESNLKELTGTPECHRLVTLMLQRNLNLSVISDDFFCNMPILNVLDLSYTGIKVVPKSVGGLLQLQFLNLVSTDIDSLPEELGNLGKLKYLNLGGTRVSNIPRGMVSCFSKMQMLDFGETKLDDSLAAELESLEQLRELGITITKIPTPLSQQLTSCITTLEIRDCVGLTKLSLLSSPLFRKTRRLREFEIRNCLELEMFNINCLEEDEDEVGPLFTLMVLQICGLPKLNNIIWAETTTHLQFSNLQAVFIRSCPTLKDISWLVLAPMLMYLKVGDCLELEEIILGRFTTAIDRNQDLFSRLEYFDLEGLLKLKSIVRFAPLFPCLHGIFVSDCPLLKKLPLASASTDKSKLVIRGKADWWNELQWENEIVKSTFQPFFRPRRVK